MMMTLHLRFYKDETDQSKLLCAHVLPVVPRDSEGYAESVAVWQRGIEWGDSDLVYVEAELAHVGGVQRIVAGRYQLSLRGRSDYVLRSGRDGMFTDRHEASRIQLFRGAAGLCMLQLSWRTNASERYDWVVIGECPISVRPSEEKLELLHGMVDELLDFDSLQALSSIDGISKIPVRTRWRRHWLASDVWHPRERLSEILILHDFLRVHFERIVDNSVRRIVRKSTTVRPDCKPYQVVGRHCRSLWNVRLRGAGGLSVPRLEISYDIPIHRAIKDFLHVICQCLSEMDVALEKSCEQDRASMKTVPRFAGFRADDIFSEIREKESLRGEIANTLVKFQRYLGSRYPWSRCSRRSVFTLGVGDVPESESYKCVYFQMLEFLQKRNFTGAFEGRFSIPEFCRGGDDEPASAWLRGYSYIYEAWVFKRLVQAFVAEGFVEAGTSYRETLIRNIRNVHLGHSVNDPIHASISLDGICVDIYYGVLGYRDGCMQTQGFTSGSKDMLTPDFALVFSKAAENEDGRHCHWIVLDAKSNKHLPIKALEKRNEYADMFKYQNYAPSQSWLVYSGPADFAAGWEFQSKDVDVVRCWSRDIRDKQIDILHANEGLEISEERGITGWTNHRVLAHLRVNVRNNPDDARDWIRRFVRMEIATARNLLQDASQI